MAGGGGDCFFVVADRPHVFVGLHKVVHCEVCNAGFAHAAGVGDVLGEEFSIDGLAFDEGGTHTLRTVERNYVVGKSAVVGFTLLVKDQVDQVKSTHQGRG